MGWASGSNIMEGVIRAIDGRIANEKTRIAIYKDIIDVMEFADWDTQDECVGIDKAFDKALRELHPDWDI